ncbi:MAG: ArsR family transcriptional regulator [Candidatus Hodarchaeales archaeon]|jgi:predicted transcriptional regulator
MNSKKHLITEFANPIRIEILQQLSLSPISFTDLSKRLNISNSEVSRHLNRLTEQRFVHKELGSKNLKLTSFGELMITVFSPLDFIFHHAEFFQNHDLTNLPSLFKHDLDQLIDAELIQGTGNIMLKIQELTEALKEEVWVMTDQAFPFGKQGMDTRYIVPPEMAKYSPNIEDFNRSTIARVLPHISIALLVADKESGMIFFPDNHGNPDFSQGFYVKKENELGIEYIRRLWNYFWEKGKALT